MLYAGYLGPSRALNTFRTKADLAKTQWLSRSELLDDQANRLTKLLRFSYEHVPYYRNLFKHRNICPHRLDCFDAIQRLPTLSRKDLLANQSALTARRTATGAFVNFSSGSTGQRAEFVQDRSFIDFVRALQFRGYSWCGGWRVNEPFALVWGSPVHSSFDGAKKAVARFLSNRRQINCYQLGEHQLETMLQRLIRLRPALISGYSTALYLLGRLLTKRGLRFRNLRAVQATAEPLPESMRIRMGSDYGVPILSKYGSRETNMIAHQSPHHHGMYIQTENVFLEFVNPDGKLCAAGEKGEIIVTTLNNFSMPLIRYSTRDVGSLLDARCPSGRGFPMMSEVEGRQHEVLFTPDGDAIHPQVFSNLFMRSDGIEWFQVVQEASTQLRVRIVPTECWSDQCAHQLQQDLTELTGFAFSIEFELLDEMPSSDTGKQPLTVPLKRAVEDCSSRLS